MGPGKVESGEAIMPTHSPSSSLGFPRSPLSPKSPVSTYKEPKKKARINTLSHLSGLYLFYYFWGLLQTAVSQQWIRTRLLAAEVDIHLHSVIDSARRKDVDTELIR